MHCALCEPGARDYILITCRLGRGQGETAEPERRRLHASARYLGAEVDFREAMSITEHNTQTDPSVLAAVLANYAYLLRATHRKREARAMDERVKAMPSRAARDLLIDISALRRKR